MIEPLFSLSDFVLPRRHRKISKNFVMATVQRPNVGAILFFVLSEMSLINTMYQYSLTSYLDVFEFSLRKSIPDANLERRLKNIMSTLTLNVYNYGCTGIFEKHKLLFSFDITIKLEQDRGNLTQDELDFFIKGNLSLEKSKRKKTLRLDSRSNLGRLCASIQRLQYICHSTR